MVALDDFNYTLKGRRLQHQEKVAELKAELEEEFGMKKKLLSLLVAMLFTAGTFALPISASAQGTSGQMTEEGQAKKSTAKKSKKKSTAKKPSTSQKKKTTSKKTQEQT
jgi:hypothetical protein